MRHRLPQLEPISRGVMLGLFSVTLASAGVFFFISAAPVASVELLQSLATIGAILLAAYVVEAVWLLPRLGHGEELEEWMGFIVGAALAVLLGIALALLLAQHRAAGHANHLDDLGLAWVAVSQLVLAGALVLQPLLAHHFDELGED